MLQPLYRRYSGLRPKAQPRDPVSRDCPDHYDVFGPAPYPDPFSEYLAPSGGAPGEMEAVEDDPLTQEAILKRHEAERRDYR